MIGKDARIDDVLDFYMGKNTPDRQEFIIENLRVEEWWCRNRNSWINKPDSLILFLEHKP